MSVFALPDLGEGLHEAEIVAWHVTAGDHVVADQPLVSVETDKAVVEVPSPRSGRIARIHGAPGEDIAVGAPLVEFEDAARVDEGTVVGRLTPAAPAPVLAPATPAKSVAPRPMPAAAGAPADAVKAAPAVRALARQLGVELASLKPSGAQGQITSADVERAAKAPRLAEGYEPLKGVRKAMAENMERAHAEVVPASITDQADVDAWAGAASEPRAGPSEKADVTLRLIRAIAAACKVEPSLNAWYDGRAMARKLHKHINLGIAIDTGDGLFAPVLHNIGEREPADIRRGIERLKADLKTRSVPREELHGQTITLSNFGTIAGVHAVLVVVPPQVAIIGAGKIARQVVVAGGRYEARQLLPLSLTFDHRSITGGEAARFLAALIADLEQPS